MKNDEESMFEDKNTIHSNGSNQELYEVDVSSNNDDEQQNFLLFTQEDEDIANSTDESTEHKPNSTFIGDRIEFISSHRRTYRNTSFSSVDIALIELYNSHKKAGAPNCLVDKTISWLQRHGNSFFTTSTGVKVLPKQKIPSRSSFIKKIYEKVYSKKFHTNVLPKEISIPITPTTQQSHHLISVKC